MLEMGGGGTGGTLPFRGRFPPERSPAWALQPRFLRMATAGVSPRNYDMLSHYSPAAWCAVRVPVGGWRGKDWGLWVVDGWARY